MEAAEAAVVVLVIMYPVCLVGLVCCQDHMEVAMALAVEEALAWVQALELAEIAIRSL